MLNIGCQRSMTRHHGSYCRGEKKTCTRLCYNMQEANKTKWKLTRHWIKDASLQQNCYITPVEVYSKRWLGLVFCFPPQTQRRNKFFSMPKLLGSIWLGWNREDRKWWKKKKKMFCWESKWGKKMVRLGSFLSGPTKTLSPNRGENSSGNLLLYLDEIVPIQRPYYLNFCVFFSSVILFSSWFCFFVSFI